MAAKIYPLQFEPILKERIWGGEKLERILNKTITSNITGESWELSTVDGDVSVIANGELKNELKNSFSSKDKILYMYNEYEQH